MAFTLRFPPGTIKHADVSFKKMRRMLVSWAEKPREKRGGDIIAVQLYGDVIEPDIRIEIRLKIVPAEPRDGFIIKCSWGAWYYSSSPKKDFPHEPPQGYELSEQNIRSTVLPILRNYYRDIICDRYKISTAPPIDREHFNVFIFTSQAEGEFHKRIIDDCLHITKEAEELLSIATDEYMHPIYDNWHPLTTREVFMRSQAGPICPDKI